MPDLNLLKYCNSERQESIIRMKYKGLSTGDVAEAIGIAPRNVQLNIARVKERAANDGYMSHADKGLTAKALQSAERIVITSAQNDTPVNEAFLSVLESYCQNNNAQLGVILTKYKNPDAFSMRGDADYKWPDAVLQYAITGDVSLNKSLKIIGSLNINATAKYPLSGNEPLGGAASTIFGHPQVAMESVATPKSRTPKIMHTTGSVSERNYSKSKAGKIGHFNHSFSALIVEKEGAKFWMREVHFDGIGFYDLDKYYTSESTTEGHRLSAMIFGDTHEVHLPESFVKATHGKGGLCEKLQPEKYIFHDLYDHYSGSHHHECDFILRLVKQAKGESDVRNELDSCVRFLDSVVPENAEAHIVDSNHHSHLAKWVNRLDPKKDLVNAGIYFELMNEISRAAEKGIKEDPFELYVKKHSKINVNFADCNKPFLINEVDCSQHGDRGPNGSRGTVRGFAKTTYKTVVGHGHSPSISQGCYRVGVSSIDMAYASGYSSWLITHCGIYPNGKRTMFHMIDGRYWK